VKVLHSLDEVVVGRRAIAIGTFDGVHLGHQAVIGRTVSVAREHGIGSAVVTFHPHPMTVLRPELAPAELTTLARKTELVDRVGPDEMIVIRFDHALSQMEHDEFETRVLKGALGAAYVAVGDNFRYGHRARGGVETLREAGKRLGFEVEPAPLVEVDGAPVSSSRVRELLAAGDVAAAGRLLGRPPSVEGIVVRGDGRGRGLGFATANIDQAPRSAVPAVGVYAGTGHVAGVSRPAAISVGFNPTFTDDRSKLRIEAHLLDFDQDVYGEPMRIDFTERLRGEEKFDSVDELVEQVHRDIDAVRQAAKRVSIG
jgi:riboflavin kinase/FMN adenylyltransferase